MFMTLWIALAMTVSNLWAQEPSRFERYCRQIATPAADIAPHANSMTDSLRAVVDKTNNLDQLMNASVKAGNNYQDFKAEMAKRSIVLNDDYHSGNYALAAKSKCDVLIAESASGNNSVEAHVSPTDGQSMRKVDDSGIGVTPTGTSSGPSGTEH